ncbi:MAG: PTS transporter subunit EIIB [Bacilli bacterium]|nr:PTS transporter subunit EIIB [Bacilli bacterium]
MTQHFILNFLSTLVISAQWALSTAGTYIWLLWIIIPAVLALMVFFGYQLYLKKHKAKGSLISNDLVESFITGFGGIKNIETIFCEGSRLRVTVADLKKCNCEILKENGGKGIFVSGKQVKLTLNANVAAITSEIEARRKERTL